MTTTTSRSLIAVILIILIGGVIWYMRRDTSYMAITTFKECADAGYPVAESMPETCRTPDGRTFTNTVIVATSTQATSTPVQSTTPSTSGNATAKEIRNVNVKANDVLTSPLTVTGEAAGWYFEASFPVQLLDGTGKIIAQGPAQAQGDWMTTNFVPFKATLTFAKPATATGTLVLRNDNPSGLPENDRFLRIPVRFTSSTQASTSVQIQVQ